jgi:hypothetical protein
MYTQKGCVASPSTFISTPRKYEKSRLITMMMMMMIIIKLANKPYIVLQDKKEKTCLLIDRVIPDDLNVNTTDTERPEKLRK